MIDKLLKQKIEALAYEKYLYRMANGLFQVVDNFGHLRDITAEDDYLEAEKDLCDRRQIDNCPKCGFTILSRENNNLICLRSGCDWKVTAKRNTDTKIPDIQELKRDFNG